ncbi:hypothetical protein GpartN1_g76.t1 [Galdieria partita]|uniref:Uncharacterized protein n=1 Tax=Galdieria partita TaxID=83374 RepID=A0A9C7PPX7_9RHOD|nr:hypothetical protein GpartN1_g76.t1 [Galdieria partita]
MKLQSMRSYDAVFLCAEFFHPSSLPKPFYRRALPCRNSIRHRYGTKCDTRIARHRERVQFSCLAVRYRKYFGILHKFVFRKFTNKPSSLPGRNRPLREEKEKTSTLNNVKEPPSQTFSEHLCSGQAETFIQVLQKGQRNGQVQRLTQEHKEQLISFAKSVESSRSKRTKAVYFLVSILFLTISFLLIVPTKQYYSSFSKPVEWIGLLFGWERHFGPLVSFVTPIMLFTYTFFFPLSFRDTYRRYILSYFLVLFAQGIASICSFTGFGYIRLCTEIVLYGIYIPVVLWAWSDLKVELEMAYILDKRYSFVFNFWRILRTCECFISTVARIFFIFILYSSRTMLFGNETSINSLKCMLGFSQFSIYGWKELVLSRVGFVLLYCYILYSLLFFTVFVDCGSEFYSRHDISPFTQIFLCLGLLDRNLTKREARKKTVAWTGFFAAIDKKLEEMFVSGRDSVDVRDGANYPLKNQSNVFSFIANFEVPWDGEPELQEEVLLPFRQYLDNVALAIRARNEAYPKSDENKLLPGSARELESAMLLFSKAIPPNRQHYDVEQLYDEPEGNLSVNSDKTEHSSERSKI